MRLEIFIIGITAFFVYNAYTDGKYTKMLMSFKKYYKMIFYVSLGIGIYILLKRNPNQGRKLLLYANNMVKFMPIDKTSVDMLSPVFDFTTNDENDFNSSNNNVSFMESLNGQNTPKLGHGLFNEKKIGVKRSVSETKKKYVAANQDWKCGNCQEQLDHTFEIDHKIRLEYGGGNDTQNLIALCRNCHGRKTARENM